MAARSGAGQCQCQWQFTQEDSTIPLHHSLRMAFLPFRLPALPAKGKGNDDLVDDVLDDLWDAANTRAGCLLLTDGARGTSSVLRSTAAVPGVTTKVITENCGEAYQDLYTLKKRGASAVRVGGGAGSLGARGGGAAAAPGADEYRAATPAERKLMSGYAAADPPNCYGLLGLTELNLGATEAQIRAAHTRQVKRFHPDKAKSGSGGNSEGAEDDADAENVFLALNRAFEILTCPEKRRAFDSVYDFDDTIPAEPKPGKEFKGDFFAVFGPVFERNGRFSSIQPVPRLGGPEDDDASVKAFYNFWANFDSWREFSHAGTAKLDGGEDREERRRAEKENAAAAAKAKKAEVQRVNKLTELARALDPRCKAILRREKDARNAGALAKAAAKAAEEAAAEAARAAEAEARAAGEAAELAAKRGDKFVKEKEKKHASRAKAALRKLADPAAPAADPAALSEVNIEFLLAKLEGPAAIALHQEVFGAEAAEAVRALAVADAEKACAPKEEKKKGGAGAAGGSKDSASSTASAPAPAALNPAALAAAIQRERGGGSASASASAAPAAEAGSAGSASAGSASAGSGSSPASARAWAPAELASLARACQKYPAGTPKRWVCVAEAVNGELGKGAPKRSIGECTARGSTLAEGEGLEAEGEGAAAASAE